MQAMIIPQAVGSSKVVWDKVFSSLRMEESHQRRNRLDVAAHRSAVNIAKILLILKALTEGLIRATFL